jgi:SPP1 family holin
MTVIVAVNVIFGYLGWHIISLSDSEVGNMVDGAIVLVTIFVWGWGWWKNNSLTLNAQIADTVLDQLKSGESNG